MGMSSREQEFGFGGAITLGAMLALGAYLRFSGLLGRGLVEWDEAHYLMEAKFLHSAYAQFFNLLGALQKGDPQHLMALLDGWPVVSAKPGHAFLIFLLAVIVGMTDHVGSLLNAGLGIATVFLVYQVGRSFWGRLVGLVSASVLAVSGLHVMYSRSSLAEVSSSFFFLLGIYWLLLGLDGERMNRKCLWGGGAAFGYSLTVNYRWFFVGLLLILGELAWACFARDRVARRLLFMRVGMFFGFAALPVIFFQMPYWAAGWMGKVPEHALAGGYWQSLFWFYTVKPAQGNFQPHGLYIRSLVLLEGFIPVALAALGAGLSVWGWKDLRKLMVGAAMLLPLAVFSLTTRGDRLVAISLIAPFFAICAGLGADGVLSVLPGRYRKGAFLALAALIAGLGLNRVAWNLSVQSGWKEVAEYARGREPGKLLTFQSAIGKFYLGREMVRVPPESGAELARYVQEGFHLLAVDWKKYHADNYKPWIRDIETRCKPVFSARHDVRFFPIFVDDFHYPHPNSALPQPVNLFERILSDPSVGSIQVYDIRRYLTSKCGASTAIPSRTFLPS